MIKIAFCMICAVVFASAASAAQTPVLRVTLHAQQVGATVSVKVSLNSGSAVPGKVTTVVFSNCRFGQQTPMSLARRTRHLDGETENLLRHGKGLEWNMKTLPALGSKSRTLTLVFALPRNKGGRNFCVHTATTVWASHKTKELELTLPLS